MAGGESWWLRPRCAEKIATSAKAIISVLSPSMKPWFQRQRQHREVNRKAFWPEAEHWNNSTGQNGTAGTLLNRIRRWDFIRCLTALGRGQPTTTIAQGTRRVDGRATRRCLTLPGRGWGVGQAGERQQSPVGGQRQQQQQTAVQPPPCHGGQAPEPGGGVIQRAAPSPWRKKGGGRRFRGRRCFMKRNWRNENGFVDVTTTEQYFMCGNEHQNNSSVHERTFPANQKKI